LRFQPVARSLRSSAADQDYIAHQIQHFRAGPPPRTVSKPVTQDQRLTATSAALFAPVHMRTGRVSPRWRA
jgi:hypothetical protein